MKEAVAPYFAELPQGYLIIENVPCRRCDQCGETVFANSVVKKIEAILCAHQQNAPKVTVLDFHSAA